MTNAKLTHRYSPSTRSPEMSASPSPTSTPALPPQTDKSQLSPKEIQLPPSPPFDSDYDSDTLPQRIQRPPPPQRHGSDSSITAKPFLHQLPVRPRNHSPTTPNTSLHTAGGIIMPLMQRAHSSPGVDSSGRFIPPGSYHGSVPRRPASPLSTGRRRSPLRSTMEESYPRTSLSIEPNIPENEELDLSEHFAEEFGHTSPIPTYHNTFPRSRRRPTSPLHLSASAPSLSTVYPRSDARAISPHNYGTGTSSPQPGRYYANEPYPNSANFSFGSTSSMPSTPSSFRSRSPSISSLETIEDSPDAEEAAEEDAKFRAEMGDSGSEFGDGRRRGSLEGRGTALRSNKERKRWSVCGAERRADFSLEVIEE